MRWDDLFADLEAAADAEDRLEYEAEVAEQTRAEYAAVHLADRLRAQHDRDLVCLLADGSRLEGRVRDVGAQWLLLETRQGEVIVPLAALAGVDGMTRAAAVPAGPVDRRAGLGVVLRRLSVEGVPVRLALLGGTEISGTVDRVGADHLELAVHPLDVPRRPATVTAIRMVPTSALLRVVLGRG